MKLNLFGFIVLSAVGVACTEPQPVSPEMDWRLEIGAVLTETGRDTLLLDPNGLYHLRLDRYRNQTIRRVTGRITANGDEPFPPEKIEWESNLYWYIRRGDTVLYPVTEVYKNYFTGQLTTIVLPPLISQVEELVPTVNCCSYNGDMGVINTMIAPVLEMVGDTLIVRATHSPSGKTATTKIVLE